LYCPDNGREATDPALLLKVCFLESKYRLSDREVMSRAQTDLAFRVFLHLRLEDTVPHPTMLTVFRKRLGEEGFREVFNHSVRLGMERKLVNGKLLLSDSYGVVADVAVPKLRRLLMRIVRSQLQWLVTQGADVTLLLEEEATLLEDTSWWQGKALREKDALEWILLTRCVGEALEAAEVSPAAWPERDRRRTLVEKVLERDPQVRTKGRRDSLVSEVDPDARWSMREGGKKAFVGYKEQIAMDHESQIIVAVQTTPANVDDKGMLEPLVEQAEANMGGPPDAVGADSGYSSGENRERLQDKGIADFVAVPTAKGHKQGRFSAEDFTPKWGLDGSPVEVRCPAGQLTTKGRWKPDDKGWTFYFRKGQCKGCSLREQCTQSSKGRTVFISDYFEIHRQARERSQTEEFQVAQIQRLGIERVFAEQQRQSGKRARFRGLPRVSIQVLMSCFTVNVARITKAVSASPQGENSPRGLPVSAMGGG
jgi:IS5 family transposase